ncbi:MAG: hypothetical protein WC575_03225 [Patescibacteria group bacterium]
MKKIALGLFVIILVLSGCTFGISNKALGGGVFKSSDNGVIWQQKIFVAKGKKTNVTIDSMNVSRIIFSPLDSKTVYALSPESGIYISENEADQWKKYFGAGVNSLALHPQQKDISYIASGNKIYKTIDGGQNWLQIYIEGTPDVSLTDIIIDNNNFDVLFSTTSKGTLLKSLDAGNSWQALYRFNKGISRLFLNLQTGVMYAAMPTRGLWRSVDKGLTWEDLQPNLESLVKKPGTFRQMIFIPGTVDGLFYVTAYGLFKTVDGGKSWTSINLVTPPSAVGINTLTINPQANNEIFYALNFLIYYSSDGGINWVTRPSPAKQAATALTINPNDPNIVYMGTTRIKK